MDKNTKKKVIFMIGIVIILIGVYLLAMQLRKEDISGNKDYTFEQIGNIPVEGMEPVNKNIVLGTVLQNVREKNAEDLIRIEDDEANQLINLREFEGLEKMVATSVTDSELTEIWLFKVSEEGQAPNLFRIFNERINALKNEYQENEKISAMLADENNIRIKQQSGVVIIIVSNDAENIEKTIDQNF